MVPSNLLYLEVLCKLELEELLRGGQQEATSPALPFTVSYRLSSGASWSEPKKVYMRVELRDDGIVDCPT